MNAADFARKRARIEQRAEGRAATFYRKAVGHLVQEAGAEVIVARGHLVGWKLPDGSFACVKHRYRDEASAILELERIGRMATRDFHIPIRHYRCEFCGGWHLTSQTKNPMNDNNPA